MCAVLLTEACNVGFTPVIKPDVPALSRGRLVQVDHGYFRAENISVANGLFIEAQAKIDVVRAWGGGLVASADGVRFTVPVQTLYAGSNPRYFGLRHKGATWLNVVHDQVMGLGGVVVPGTLRDSLFILDAIHARDGGPKPETVITDTASYSDIVFGLFAICGYQFSPRIADISDARLWRANTAADYGPLQPVSNHTIRLDRIRAHWGDMLRVAGSLAPGEVRGHDLIRMLSRDGKPTGLGDAFAHYGTDLQDPAPSPVRLRRGIPAHDRRPAQRHRGPPSPRPEDLLRTARRTGPALPRGNGGPARRPRTGPQLRSPAQQPLHRRRRQTAGRRRLPRHRRTARRLSPLQYDHINFLGRYAFTRPPAPGLRQLRDPHTDDKTDDAEDG